VEDLSLLHVLQHNYPLAGTVSARTGEGLDELERAVVEALRADFVDAEVTTAAGNGKVLAYLAGHAEVSRQEFTDERVTVHCALPRYLLYHIEGPGVEVRLLDANGRVQEEGEG
jgi:GTP-binding protein HflX